MNQEVIKYITENRDMQHIIEEILKGDGRIQIDYTKGKIKRKIKTNKF